MKRHTHTHTHTHSCIHTRKHVRTRIAGEFCLGCLCVCVCVSFESLLYISLRMEKTNHNTKNNRKRRCCVSSLRHSTTYPWKSRSLERTLRAGRTLLDCLVCELASWSLEHSLRVAFCVIAVTPAVLKSLNHVSFPFFLKSEYNQQVTIRQYST